MKLDKDKEEFVNKHCLNQKIVSIKWVNELEAYRCMLENGAYIFVREIY